MSWWGENRRKGRQARLLLCALGCFVGAPVGLAQQVPRVGPMDALEFTEKYIAYVPDVGSGSPAVVAVVLRPEPPLARHLLQCWEDSADRQRVTLLAPLGMDGTAKERAERIASAISLWEARNKRKVKYMVAVGYSLSTQLAIEAALEMPDRWAGVALTPGWLLEESVKPRLQALKGMPVFMLYSKAHRADKYKAKRLRRDLEAAGCVIHQHVVERGDNAQTTYHNGDTILAWVRDITQAKKEQPPTTQPATTQLITP